MTEYMFDSIRTCMGQYVFVLFPTEQTYDVVHVVIKTDNNAHGMTLCDETRSKVKDV